VHSATAPAATVQLAAVASIAIQPLLTRPTRSGRLLGVSDHAAWIGIDDEVAVVSDREAVRLPNAVELDLDRIGRWANRDDAVSVGDGIIRVGQLSAVVRRWFDPRPALGQCATSYLGTNLEEMRGMTPSLIDAGLHDALARRDVEAIIDGCFRLLGSGEGLTPEGDDLVAGALASHLLLGRATGRDVSYMDQLVQPLGDLARTRTTSFSGALLRHALHGRVATPFADVLRSLTGRGELLTAVQRLLGVGHSSGPALAAGILTGGGAITLENAP